MGFEDKEDKEDKEKFISKCRNFNRIRIDIVHKIIRNKSLRDVQDQMGNVKEKFEEIFNLFFDIYDWFWWSFKEIRRREDWGEEFYKIEEKVVELQESLKLGTCSNTSKQELKKFEELIRIVKRWKKRDDYFDK